jgi:hypothetical protein
MVHRARQREMARPRNPPAQAIACAGSLFPLTTIRLG